VNKTNSVILYLIILILASVFLRITGIISFTSIELLSWIFMLTGITGVLYSFGLDRKGLLFISSTAFLVGIIIFINSRFDLEDTRMLLFPSVLFVIGIGFLLLFLDDTSLRVFGIISLLFLTAGVIYMMFLRDFVFTGFFISFWNLLKSYWFVLILVTGLVFLLRRET
jgi:hypothetical protein